MKILVIGGMHGNETLGIQVVQYFLNNPVKDVDVMLANEQAIIANSRFIKKDLNRSFPGNVRGELYEDRRAAWILAKTKKYDVVIDFHNTYCPNNDCAFIGQSADFLLENIAGAFGLSKVVVADYDCLNKYANNCISIEVSITSEANDPQLWYKRIKLLTKQNTVKPALKVEKYRFVYRMTLEDRDRLQLRDKNLRAFEKIDRSLARQLGVASPAYPIFIGDFFTPYNYGGLLNKLQE